MSHHLAMHQLYIYIYIYIYIYLTQIFDIPTHQWIEMHGHVFVDEEMVGGDGDIT